MNNKKVFIVSSSNAFTVIEILAVVAIIALLSSVTVVALESYQPIIDLNGTTRQIIMDLRYVQQLAVSEQIKYGIQFFKDENKYQIIKYNTPEEIINEKNLPAGITFYSINGLSNGRVQFNPYGSVEEDGEIILLNSQTNTRTIQIKPSGFIKMQ